jgi:hypothetical protein
VRLEEGIARLKVCAVKGAVTDRELIHWTIERLQGQRHFKNAKRERDRHIRKAAEYLDGSTWSRARQLVIEAKGARFAKNSATASGQLRAAALYGTLPTTERQYFRILTS